MPISKTYKICDAYEAGFGTGIDGKEYTNPYDPTIEEYEAWDIGFFEGKKRKEELTKNEATLLDRYHALDSNSQNSIDIVIISAKTKEDVSIVLTKCETLYSTEPVPSIKFQ